MNDERSFEMPCRLLVRFPIVLKLFGQKGAFNAKFNSSKIFFYVATIESISVPVVSYCKSVKQKKRDSSSREISTTLINQLSHDRPEYI